MKNIAIAVAVTLFSLTSTSPMFGAAQTSSLGTPALALTHRVRMMTAKPVSLGVPAYGAPLKVSMVMEVRSRFGDPNQKPRLSIDPVPVHLGQTSTPAIKR